MHAASAGYAVHKYVPWLNPYHNCPFKRLTGISCPFCGTLGAFSNLVRGDITGAFRMNPLAAGAMLAIVFVSLLDIIGIACGRQVDYMGTLKKVMRPCRIFVIITTNWMILIL